MPLDKHNTNKPFLPRVATHSNNAKSSPITPRIAAQHLRPGSSSPSIAETPTLRGDLLRQTGVRSPITREEPTVSTGYFGNNVTPRSTHRKSRIDNGSNQSTPTSTPIHKPVNGSSGRGRVSGGSSTVGKSLHKRPNSVVGENQGAVTSLLGRQAVVAPKSRSGHTSPRDATASSSFFHASDARTQEAAPPPQPPKKAATFFYANGIQEDEPPQSLPPRAASPALSSVSTRSQRNQFYHANGRPDNDGLQTITSPPLRSSPELRPAFSRTNSAASAPFPMRPPSPHKSSLRDLHLTYRKGASQILPSITRQSPAPVLSPSPQDISNPRQRSTSIDAQLQSARPHVRAGSLSSIDSSPNSRQSSLTILDTQLRHNLHNIRGSPTSAPATRLPPTSNPTFDEPTSDGRPNTAGSVKAQTAIFSLPQSPTQVPTSITSPLPSSFAEAAANARRERKVLDLEISNSSLLAINKQLEREVRRQKAELRRFRRLSRAGRLTSIGSMMHNLDGDEDGGRLSGAGSEDDYLSDLSEDEEQDFSLSDESMDSSISPEAMSQREKDRLAKDEKRLHVDLERHRQLLVDSQKMNQSLKTCMTLTEEMIAEGRKALEYKVRVSDVRLGGRVLDNEDQSILTTDDSIIHDIGDPEVETLSHEEDDDSELEHRNGLLGSWSPPDNATPLATLMNATDGLLGLGVDFSDHNGPDFRTSGGELGTAPWAAGERDSGVHVDEADEILKQIARDSGDYNQELGYDPGPGEHKPPPSTDQFQADVDRLGSMPLR